MPPPPRDGLALGARGFHGHTAGAGAAPAADKEAQEKGPGGDRSPGDPGLCLWVCRWAGGRKGSLTPAHPRPPIPKRGSEQGYPSEGAWGTGKAARPNRA